MKTASSQENLPNQESPQAGKLLPDDLKKVRSREELKTLLEEKQINFERAANNLKYEEDLVLLQIELVKLQQWIMKTEKRVAVIFEGRDAAGKGGTIRRFVEHLNPRSIRVVALDRPTKVEKGQWYFTRYVKQLPNPGTIVFFDRSWYNRAVIEPVMGYCTKTEYKQFMQQVPEFEHMLYEDGIEVIKFWFSISKSEQLSRFERRQTNPLKRWKMSTVDRKAQEYWDKVTHYKEEMFSKTHTAFSPWIIIKANKKKQARLESIRHVLSSFEYDGRDSAKTRIYPDPNIVMRFHRSTVQID